jgi:hypothetical protein
MQAIAPDVHRIALLPGGGLNAYLVGDVLVDAGLSRSAGTILEVLGGRTVSEHSQRTPTSTTLAARHASSPS